MALVALPGVVLGHAQLVSSTPADGAEVPSSPTEIRLVFSESPRLDGLSVRLFDRRGQEVELEAPRRDAAFPTTVQITIPVELRPGPYTVVWTVISEVDDHPEANELVFGVRGPAAEPSVTAASLGGGGSSALQVAALLAGSLALVLLLGAAVQARWFGHEGSGMARIVLAGSVLAAAGVLIALVAKAAQPRVAREAGGLLAEVSGLDTLRIALAVGLVALAAILTGQPGGPARRRAWEIVAVLGVALAWSQAAGSHAAGVGILPWVGLAWRNVDAAIQSPELYRWYGVLFEGVRQLDIAVAALHLVAVSAWIGGLVVVGLAPPAAGELRTWHPQFSTFALVAFVVVALTGLYQAALYLPEPVALVATDYGRTLLGKHVFVVGVLVLAGINRFVVGPAFRGARRLARLASRPLATLRSEAALGIVVLAVSALLATTPTARPPTQIFLVPDIAARLAEQPARIAGDRGGFDLLVTRKSAAQNRIVLRTPQGTSITGSLLLAEEGAPEPRELTLQRAGDGWTAEGVTFPRDGAWEIVAPLSDGTSVSFLAEVKDGWVLAGDPVARAAWDGAIERTEREVRSARMVDQLTDGLSSLLFGHHEYSAPDRERFEVPGRFTHVFVGDRSFFREAGADRWTVEERSVPYRWPDLRFLRPAIGIVREGTGSQAGEACDVYAGHDPVSGVTYELWVGHDDGLIHRLVMGLPGHYMVNAYYDLNAPISVHPPA